MKRLSGMIKLLDIPTSGNQDFATTLTWYE